MIITIPHARAVKVEMERCIIFSIPGIKEYRFVYLCCLTVESSTIDSFSWNRYSGAGHWYWRHPEGLAIARSLIVSGELFNYCVLLDWMMEHIEDLTHSNITSNYDGVFQSRLLLELLTREMHVATTATELIVKNKW